MKKITTSFRENLLNFANLTIFREKKILNGFFTKLYPVKLQFFIFFQKNFLNFFKNIHLQNLRFTNLLKFIQKNSQILAFSICGNRSAQNSPTLFKCQKIFRKSDYKKSDRWGDILLSFFNLAFKQGWWMGLTN